MKRGEHALLAPTGLAVFSVSLCLAWGQISQPIRHVSLQVPADSPGVVLVSPRGVTDKDYRFERLTHDIIKVFFETANELGSGFTENVYAPAMVLSLTQAGFVVRRDVALPVWFRGQQIAMFRADAIVENVVLLEFKAAQSIEPWHEAQVLTICEPLTWKSATS
jgi:GxxExxY protein